MRRILILAAVLVMGVPVMTSAQTRPQGERGGGGERGARGGRPGEMRDGPMREAMNTLKLSDEQKAKVDEIMKKFREEMQSKMEQLRDSEPRERMQALRPVFEDLQKQLKSVLTEDQQKELQEKMSRMRPGGGPGGAGGATTRPGGAGASGGGSGGGGQFPMLERMRENLKKLDLTAEQKKQIEQVLAEMKPKFEELRGEMVGGAAGAMEQMREKVQPLMREMREKVGQILTEEQKQKLQEMMPGPGGGGGRDGGAGARPRGRGGQNTTAPAKKDKGDQAMMDSGDMGGDHANAGGGAATVAKSGEGGGKSVEVGEPAPNFELKKLDGRNVQLSFYKGRVVVLVFGSYSTPVFRDRAAALEKLAREHRNVEFLLIYTKEAHPAGSKELDRNKNDDIDIAQHADENGRVEQAKKTKEALKLTVPIVTDTMDDATAKAYGLMPNGAAIIAKDGTIAFRQKWFEPYSLGMGIEEAMKTRTP